MIKEKLTMAIKILSETVTSQIAAGEVVERPASVVKELLENALDAKSRSIEIQVNQAGKELIEVSDDGIGIPGDELMLAVARHATSKLESAEDLERIKTLGFRGEALASIASVSNLTIESQSEAAKVGKRLMVKGGKVGQLDEIGMSHGTRVKVQALFSNIPARLKFLKHDLTEKNQIISLVNRYAVEYSDVRFSLKMDSRSIFQTYGRNDKREVLTQQYGLEIGRQLVETEFEDGDIRIVGFVSPISLTRSNRKELIFFVNGRLVQDVTLGTAFVQAYHSLLMVGRYPMGFLSIRLRPEDVDVNVHPSKSEVRFRETDRVFGSVQRAVKRALLDGGVKVPALTVGWIPVSLQAQSSFPVQARSAERNFHSPGPQQSPVEFGQGFTPIQPPIARLPLLRTIGQVGLAYIVAEGPDGLYLIDQHAAHERVLFEKFHSQVQARISSQSLLVPRLIHLPVKAAAVLIDQLLTLKSLGFEIEEFGENTFRILAVPGFLADQGEETLIQAALEQAEEDETPFQNAWDLKLIARICKRVAIKSGKILTLEEARKLIEQLEACSQPRTCPHGRPAMIHLSVDLLERQFGRRGAR